MRRLRLLIGTLVTAAALASPGATAHAAQPSIATALDWNETMVTTVRAGVPFQGAGLIYTAYVQAAVYDAVTAIQGGYEQYRTNLSAPEGAMPEAAVAAAAHRTLVNYFPAQATALDSEYAASIASLTPGPARDEGVAVGEAAAQAIIAMRSGDVRSGSGGYSFPAPGAGIWALPYPTPDSQATTPQTPWIGQLTPFMLQSPSQFRPGAPNSITSEKYADDLAEVETLGGASSTARTPEQTLIARFWSSNVLTQYNTALRALAVQRGMGLEDTVRLFAMVDMAVGDATIACWDAKYAYSFWRPIQAIRAGGSDPTWMPLLAPTPNHPEYPSAHGCITTAFADGLSAALGTHHIDVDVPGINPATGTFDAGYTRHFDTPRDMSREIEDARVWGGFHFRSSVVAGVELGDDVARYDLRRNFRPANGDAADQSDD